MDDEGNTKAIKQGPKAWGQAIPLPHPSCRTLAGKRLPKR